jgi:hypothetical protein
VTTRHATAALLAAVVLGVITAPPAWAQLEELIRSLPGQSKPAGSGLSDGKIVSGLKEALEVGAGRAVDLTGAVDGYFKNQAIKILLPEQLRSVEPSLRVIGLGPQIDAFVLAMNRAAESAAPAARRIFVDAVGAITFEDARKILGGGGTAATDYFKERTSGRLTEAFRPAVERSMSEVGVVRQYKRLVELTENLPLLKTEAVDVDGYVTGKALDGLFHVLGEQERQIRTNPTARATELLREVFGSVASR